MSLEQQLANLLGRGGAGGAGPAAGPLLEFRAGKMTLSGTTVTADPRRGKVVLTDDNGLLRFQWKPRPSGAVEENLLIFPDDCKVELVPECTTGRVILMRFSSDQSKKLFYWLQEPNVILAFWVSRN
jgi:26S proteasome regulatory subunit N13